MFEFIGIVALVWSCLGIVAFVKMRDIISEEDCERQMFIAGPAIWIVVLIILIKEWYDGEG